MSEKISNCKWLEVLHSALRNQLQSKEDCLVAALHCIMINRGNKCIGVGDDWNQDSDTPSDLLHAGWNSSQGNYSLRYVSESAPVKYLLKIIKVNDTLLINLLDVDKDKAAGMSVKVDNHVTDDIKVYSGLYKNLEKVEKEFEDAVMKNFKSEDETAKKPTTSRKVTQEEEDPSPLLEERFLDSRRFTDPVGRSAIPSVGRGDLDPFGGFYGGGGGMLLDPGSMGSGRPTMPDFGIGGPAGLPRGAVPPGARFDPFGPPMRGRGPASSRPDPDHLPPPGFSDSFI